MAETGIIHGRRNIYKNKSGKSQVEGTCERPTIQWKTYVKMDLREICELVLNLLRIECNALYL
jgi:hypothetical protein